jgi:hypothetical protein
VVVGGDHKGICGTYQSAPKMKWLLTMAGFIGPSMIVDYFRCYKGCKECQKFCNIQLVPAAIVHSFIKLWPFRGWGFDFIGQIHPPSSKGYCFMFVATNYCTKWTKVVPLKYMAHVEVIEFIIEHIIYIDLA